MTLGFEQAGFDVLAAVEIDPVHCATHEFNFPFWSVICQSVVNIEATDIRARSEIKDRDIDVVFGGPPCQGFSLIGKRSLDDPRNSLVSHFMRLVIELQPKYFVMENVKGLTVGKHRQLLLEIIQEFQSNGYVVEEKYQVLNAAHYGVPQHRERLFLLGCREGLALPAYPQPTSKLARAKKSSLLEPADLPACPTVWEAIADLPEIENYPELWQQDSCIAEYGKPSNYSSMLRALTTQIGDYSYERHCDRRVITSSIRTHHHQDLIARFAETKPGTRDTISRFFKLEAEGICNTLRAGTPSNRGAFTSPRPIHPLTPRCISVREAARLHSYPDWFRLHVTKWHGFRQIGNSVPPLLARAVANQIMQALDVKAFKPFDLMHLGKEQLLHLKMHQAADLYGVDRQVIEPRIKKPSVILD